MLKVKKYKSPNSGIYGVTHPVTLQESEQPESITYKNEINLLENDIIHYKLISVYDDKVVYDLKIDIEDIKSQSSYDEQTLWAIDDAFLNNNKYADNIVVPSGVYRNVFSQTVLGKTQFVDYAFGFGLSPLKIFIPSAQSTINDIYILICEGGLNVTDPQINVVVEGDIQSENIDFTNKSLLVDAITISASNNSPVAGDDINITINAPGNVGYVYVQPLVGIVNKTRVKMTNGVGNVTIKTDSLSSGDEVDIKFGYRYFTNVVRYTKTLG